MALSPKAISDLYATDIRSFRMMTGDTIKQFAAKLGIHRNELSLFERKKKLIPFHIFKAFDGIRNPIELNKLKMEKHSPYDELLLSTQRILSRLSYRELAEVANSIIPKVEEYVKKDFDLIKKSKKTEVSDFHFPNYWEGGEFPP